ncbi:MAG: phosphodiester glycosidase family protein [Pyrinomonadaceae bacterium]|nr:phosphodiester glycosidase family protein [Pyrinomonadaceae bacterium]
MKTNIPFCHFASTDNLFAAARFSVLFLGVLCALCGETAAQDFKQVHPGVEYAEVEHKIGNDPLKINLLRLDLKKVRLDVHHAFDKAIGLETTSSIAKRKGAVAAINAGFFRLDKSEFAGDAADILMTDGRLLSEGTRGRATLFLENGKKQTNAEVRYSRLGVWLGSDQSRFRVLLSGINRPRNQGETVAFDRFYGDRTSSTEPGTEIVFTGCERKRDGWHYMASCSNFEVRENAAGTTIPPDGFVISAGNDSFPTKANLLGELKKFAALNDKKKRLIFRVEDAEQTARVFSADYDAVAGVPMLITNDQINITWEKERAARAFAESRHPRTAVAKLKDGKFLMMTVDGRQPGVSVGMSLQELAEYLLSLGAVDAMNLDGGGSTTMVLDGKVVKKPSDREGERKVGDAIVVTLRNKK